MKKALVAISVLGLVGGASYFAYAKALSPEAQACHNLERLCGAELSDDKSCAESFDELEKVAGKEMAERSAECISEADSCVEAAGCAVGASFSAAGEFLDGMNRAVNR